MSYDNMIYTITMNCNILLLTNSLWCENNVSGHQHHYAAGTWKEAA